MDIVIEGKITQEEGMSEIVQTVLDLKNLPNVVLRVTSTESDLQGRVAFAQGGFIIGGRVNNTEETGYPAVRRLLAIRAGNYAILDPGRQHSADVNQTLWISGAKVIELLPDLPESPQILIDGDLGSLNPNQGKPQVASMDLKVSARGDNAPTTVQAETSKARKFSSGDTRMAMWGFIAIIVLIGAAGIAFYWDTIASSVPGLRQVQSAPPAPGTSPASETGTGTQTAPATDQGGQK